MLSSRIKEVPGYGSKDVTLRRSNTFSPVMCGRPTVISRSSVGDSYPSYASNRQSLHSSGHFDSSMSFARPGDVSDVKENREREKKDLQNLNERLASYIEKVRFLEAQNKTLIVENGKLKKNALFEPSKIRQMYDVELQQARKIIDDLTRQKSEMEVKVVSLEDIVKLEKQEREAECRLTHDYKMRFERLYDLCGRMEGDICCMKEKNMALINEIGATREEIKRLQEDNNRLRMDLDSETTSHLNVTNKCQSLQEQLAFAIAVHEQEIRELHAMTQKDSNLEMREYWHGELTGAIREIQTEYDTRLDQIKADLETRMNMQMRDMHVRVQAAPTYDMAPVKEETKRLRNRVMELSGKINELEAKNSQINMTLRDRNMQLEDQEREIQAERMRMSEDMRKLQSELEAVLVELQILMDCKLTMEMEIAAYRKLLENEESRLHPKPTTITSSSKSAMMSTTGGRVGAMSSTDGRMGEMSTTDGPMETNEDKLAMIEQTARTTVQRTSRGPIAFAEAAPDGRYIVIENTYRGYKAQSVPLKGWKIYKVMKDGTRVEYQFGDISIAPDQSIKIWCKGAAAQKSSIDLQADFFSWGNGNSTTYIQDPAGSEKASIVQQFIM